MPSAQAGGLYQCSACSRRPFRSAAALQQHSRDSSHLQNPRCANCPYKVFANLDALQRHTRDTGHYLYNENRFTMSSSTQPNQSPVNQPALNNIEFRCPICSRLFHAQIALHDHCRDAGHQQPQAAPTRSHNTAPSIASSDDEIQGVSLSGAFAQLGIGNTNGHGPEAPYTPPSTPPAPGVEYTCGFSGCSRKFKSKHALTQHCESTGHNPTNQPATVSRAFCLSCPTRIFLTLAATQQHCSATGHTLEQRVSPRKDDAIDQFFAHFPEFPYRPDQPYHRQFRRLAKEKGWGRRHKFQLAFREAMLQAFGTDFGVDGSVEDCLVVWQELCRATGEEVVPEDIKECKELIISLHVNLVDLHEHQRDRVGTPKPTRFNTREELIAYTLGEEDKIFPRDEAYAEGLLKWLLREITGTYRGYRGRNQNRAQQV